MRLPSTCSNSTPVVVCCMEIPLVGCINANPKMTRANMNRGLPRRTICPRFAMTGSSVVARGYLSYRTQVHMNVVSLTSATRRDIGVSKPL
jgi:hypothetical protein